MISVLSFWPRRTRRRYRFEKKSSCTVGAGLVPARCRAPTRGAPTSIAAPEIEALRGTDKKFRSTNEDSKSSKLRSNEA